MPQLSLLRLLVLATICWLVDSLLFLPVELPCNSVGAHRQGVAACSRGAGPWPRQDAMCRHHRLRRSAGRNAPLGCTGSDTGANSSVQGLIAEALQQELMGTLDRAIPLLRQACDGAADTSERAEAHFQLGRILSLQRGAGGQRVLESRHHFSRAMELRPEWIQFDSRLATPDRINDVLHCYADDRGRELVDHDLRRRDAALVAEALALHSYTAATVQSTFRFPGPQTPGPFYVRKRVDHRAAAALPSQPPRTGFDVLLRLFLIGVTVPEELVISLLGLQCVLAMRRLGIVDSSPLDDAQLFSYVQLYPLSLEPALSAFGEGLSQGRGGERQRPDIILSTDWPPPVSCSLEEEPVMYIGSDSLGLVRMAAIAAQVVPASSKPSGAGPVQVLDLCTGSGIQGIAFARLMAILGASAAVKCVDINPRAARFARFNAALNGLDAEVAAEGGVEVFLGNLYEAVGGEERKDGNKEKQDFDVILANPPFVPVPQALNAEVKRYDVFADGGADGEHVIGSILAGLPAHLTKYIKSGDGDSDGPGGWLCLVTELCNPREFPTKMRAWMSEGAGSEGVDPGREFAYKALVFHDAPPHEYTAERYSQVRAGSVRERPLWQQHLHACGISSVARGYIFLQIADPGLAGDGKSDSHNHDDAADGSHGPDIDGAADGRGRGAADGSVRGAAAGDACASRAQGSPGKSVSQVVGWGGELSSWAPMNAEAASAFSRALAILARVRFE